MLLRIFERYTRFDVAGRRTPHRRLCWKAARAEANSSNAREQQKKLDRSGIHMHFAAVEIPPEKHTDAYREIEQRRSESKANGIHAASNATG